MKKEVNMLTGIFNIISIYNVIGLKQIYYLIINNRKLYKLNY